MKNPHAQALARLGTGIPKKISENDRENRRNRMIKLNLERARKKAERKKQHDANEQLVKERAKLGLFTPIA